MFLDWSEIHSQGINLLMAPVLFGHWAIKIKSGCFLRLYKFYHHILVDTIRLIKDWCVNPFTGIKKITSYHKTFFLCMKEILLLQEFYFLWQETHFLTQEIDFLWQEINFLSQEINFLSQEINFPTDPIGNLGPPGGHFGERVLPSPLWRYLLPIFGIFLLIPQDGEYTVSGKAANVDIIKYNL